MNIFNTFTDTDEIDFVKSPAFVQAYCDALEGGDCTTHGWGDIPEFTTMVDPATAVVQISRDGRVEYRLFPTGITDRFYTGGRFQRMLADGSCEFWDGLNRRSRRSWECMVGYCRRLCVEVTGHAGVCLNSRMCASCNKVRGAPQRELNPQEELFEDLYTHTSPEVWVRMTRGLQIPPMSVMEE